MTWNFVRFFNTYPKDGDLDEPHTCPAWVGKKPYVKHLKAFGCVAYAQGSTEEARFQSKEMHYAKQRKG